MSASIITSLFGDCNGDLKLLGELGAAPKLALASACLARGTNDSSGRILHSP